MVDLRIQTVTNMIYISVEKAQFFRRAANLIDQVLQNENGCSLS